MLRYSDHHDGNADGMRREACRMGLEGIICKQADAPYRAGRGRSWVKVKCRGREELIVLGWTPPGGSRTGLGALHLGYYDPEGRLHYAGGVGTGFSDDELARLSERLARTRSGSAEAAVRRRRSDAEGHSLGTAGAGRGGAVRRLVRVGPCAAGGYLGLREDKSAAEVVREPADPAAERKMVSPRQPPAQSGGGEARPGGGGAAACATGRAIRRRRSKAAAS